jgi:ankyrin repeat protein
MKLDESGNSLLHAATTHGNVDVVRFLLSEGVESTLKNKSGQTALMVAEDKQEEELCKMLGGAPL